MAHHSMPRTGLLTGAHHAWKIEIIPVASPVSLICREAVEQPAGALKPILATVAEKAASPAVDRDATCEKVRGDDHTERIRQERYRGPTRGPAYRAW